MNDPQVNSSAMVDKTVDERAGEPSYRPRGGEATADRADGGGNWRLELGIAVGLAAVTLAIFSKSLPYDFLIYDDNLYVTQNDAVKQGITVENLRWVTTAIVGANWHPLTVLSHMLDCQLFGVDPQAHRAVNLLLHSANTALVFLVLLWMTRALWPSALVAAIFGWHPLHVESVVWIAERKDVLSALFWLLAMAAYWYYTERASWPRFALVMLALGLGLLSKPMVVTLPCALLLLDWWPLGRFTRAGASWLGGALARPGIRRVVQLGVEKIPLLVLSAAGSVATLAAQRSEQAVATLELLSIADRLRNAIASYTTYVGQTFWPAGLATQYPLMPDQLDGLQTGIHVALLLAVSIVVLWWARAKPYLVVGWFWFLGTLVPVIGLVQVGGQAHADRYMYVPMIGLAVIFAWGARDIVAAWPRLQRPIVAVATVWLVVLAAMTWRQIDFWRDTESLFHRSIAVTGPNYLAHYQLGNALVHRAMEAGRANSAKHEQYLDDAIAHYARSEELNYGYRSQHFNMGHALRIKEDHAGAARQFALAIKFGLDGGDIRYSLGEALWRSGRYEDAVPQFAKAVELKPELVQASIGLAAGLAKLGRTSDAIKVYQAGLAREPNNPWFTERLARVLATSNDDAIRDPETALALARRASELADHRHPRMLDTLGAAQAAVGRYDTAIGTASEALKAARAMVANPPEKGMTEEQLRELEQQITAHIEQYQLRRPLYEPPSQEIDL